MSVLHVVGLRLGEEVNNLNEIAFTVLCFAIVILVLAIACSAYAVKLLETCKDFLDAAWNITHHEEQPEHLEGSDAD